jgi:hypothetical protein
MADQKQSNNDANGSDGIVASSPRGWKVKISGRDTIIFVLIVSLIGLFFYISEKMSLEHKESRGDHQTIIKEMRINNYLLSLPAEKRPELITPPEIWDRLRPNQDHDAAIRPTPRKKQ